MDTPNLLEIVTYVGLFHALGLYTPLFYDGGHAESKMEGHALSKMWGEAECSGEIRPRNNVVERYKIPRLTQF